MIVLLREFFVLEFSCYLVEEQSVQVSSVYFISDKEIRTCVFLFILMGISITKFNRVKMTDFSIFFTGSNKSQLANDILFSLNTLDYQFPDIYSNHAVSNVIEDIEEQPKKKQKTEAWKFVVSTITEAALSKTTNYSDVMIINPDGDNALKHLSYYEQNSMGGAQGVSSFCIGYDGIEPGSSRVTGVELSRNDRQRPSKVSMYVVSTGKKLSIPLTKMIEEGANDGVYGRVWYTHSNIVRELPDVLKKKQTSLPNFTHIAFCCHNFFQKRTIEFRYGLFRSDIVDQSQGKSSSSFVNFPSAVSCESRKRRRLTRTKE